MMNDRKILFIMLVCAVIGGAAWGWFGNLYDIEIERRASEKSWEKYRASIPFYDPAQQERAKAGPVVWEVQGDHGLVLYRIEQKVAR